MISATFNPQTAAEQGLKNYRDVTIPDAPVPETVGEAIGREGRGSEPRSL